MTEYIRPLSMTHVEGGYLQVPCLLIARLRTAYRLGAIQAVDVRAFVAMLEVSHRRNRVACAMSDAEVAELTGPLRRGWKGRLKSAGLIEGHRGAWAIAREPDEPGTLWGKRERRLVPIPRRVLKQAMADLTGKQLIAALALLGHAGRKVGSMVSWCGKVAVGKVSGWVGSGRRLVSGVCEFLFGHFANVRASAHRRQSLPITPKDVITKDHKDPLRERGGFQVPKDVMQNPIAIQTAMRTAFAAGKAKWHPAALADWCGLLAKAARVAVRPAALIADAVLKQRWNWVDDSDADEGRRLALAITAGGEARSKVGGDAGILANMLHGAMTFAMPRLDGIGWTEERLWQATLDLARFPGCSALRRFVPSRLLKKPCGSTSGSYSRTVAASSAPSTPTTACTTAKKPRPSWFAACASMLKLDPASGCVTRSVEPEQPGARPC